MWDALTTPVPLLLTLIGARIAPISYEKTSNMSGKGNMTIFPFGYMFQCSHS